MFLNVDRLIDTSFNTNIKYSALMRIHLSLLITNNLMTSITAMGNYLIMLQGWSKTSCYTDVLCLSY